MTFDQFAFARTSIRQYHAIMAISALKPTCIQLPWPDPPTLLPLVVQIIRFVPGSDGASRPFSDLRPSVYGSSTSGLSKLEPHATIDWSRTIAPRRKIWNRGRGVFDPSLPGRRKKPPSK